MVSDKWPFIAVNVVSLSGSAVGVRVVVLAKSIVFVGECTDDAVRSRGVFGQIGLSTGATLFTQEDPVEILYRMNCERLETHEAMDVFDSEPASEPTADEVCGNGE